MPASRPPLAFAELAAMPVTTLKGVGDKKAEALAEVGVANLLDLLMHYPRRYVDRSNEARIGDLVEGDESLVLARVQRVSARRTRQGRALVTVNVTDGTGHLRCTFFNQAWRERQLKVGTEAAFFGRPERYQGRLQLTNPVVDLLGDRTGRIVPIYPQSEKAGLSTWEIGGWVEEVLRRSAERGFADPVDAALLARLDLVDRATSLREIHLPETMAAAGEARRRLVFDELLRVQLALVARKRALEREAVGIAHAVGGELVGRFLAGLPFPLTGAQRRVITEIEADLAAPHPMHRLLQGDVGSGKTVVAVSALLVAVQGGRQGALMAPTEVLAEQHHAGVRALLDGFTMPDDTTLTGDRALRVELLTNRTPAAERRRLTAELAAGNVDVVIGTHALIQEGVSFASLGVVVIDEQHRFGVEQRAALREQPGGVVPDVLVMTATPIPRTAAMTVYGDLDTSELDELPPGRTPIDTVWARGPGDLADVWERVRSEVAAGRQAYVVCPLIEESEKLEAASAQATFDELSAGELARLRLGLLHGRLASRDKEQVMAAFRSGRVDVLVATTVIEVGVDVPNATVMVILDADRFGIAQLHQLRGRVGRGAAASVCFLVGGGTTPDGEARLQALASCTDGFALAEIDLELRGEGEIMGERQKGRSDLRLASLRRDRGWVELARSVAFEIVDGDPSLRRHRPLADEVRVVIGDERTDRLLRS